MRRLPPLTAIEAFVQVARLGSVKAAAEALALSSPALSRRVQALERFVGRTLFERRHQAMLLNPTGEQLLARLSPVLDKLSAAIGATIGNGEVARLRLGVSPLFATQRLIARLPELRARYPELHVDLDTAPHALARLGDGVDAAIVMSREVDAALYSRKIQQSRVVAIGAKTLDLATPEDLRHATILIHRDMPDTFEAWRAAIGQPQLEPAAVDQFDSGQLMLEAAAQGLGVAFMLDSHLESARDPRLVELFGTDVLSRYSYWFACRRSALAVRHVRIFHDWLFAAL